VGGFGQSEQWQFDWERSYTRDEWLDLVPTSGGHNQFPPPKLEELLAGIGARSTWWEAPSGWGTPWWSR